MNDSDVKFTAEEALAFHSQGRPGKIEIVATKPMATQRDLSLAYSPGVAIPVQAIADALYEFPAEEIVICLEEPERAHWLRKGVVERARERFQVSVTELDVTAREPAALA